MTTPNHLLQDAQLQLWQQLRRPAGSADVTAAAEVIGRAGRVMEQLQAGRREYEATQPWRVGVGRYSQHCQAVEVEINGPPHDPGHLEVPGPFAIAGDLLATSSPSWSDRQAHAATVAVLDVGDTAAAVLRHHHPQPPAALWALTAQSAQLTRYGHDLVPTGQAWAVLDRPLPELTSDPNRLSLARSLDTLFYQLGRTQRGDHLAVRDVRRITAVGAVLLTRLEHRLDTDPQEPMPAPAKAGVLAAAAAWRGLRVATAALDDGANPGPHALRAATDAIARIQPAGDLTADIAALDRLSDIGHQLRITFKHWGSQPRLLIAAAAAIPTPSRLAQLHSNRWVPAIPADIRPLDRLCKRAVLSTAAAAAEAHRLRPDLAIDRPAAAAVTAARSLLYRDETSRSAPTVGRHLGTPSEVGMPATKPLER